MKLTPRQTQAYKLVHQKKHNVVVFGGAIRGGKTYWLILTLASLCSKYPKSRWVIVRESLPTLKRTTFVTFQKILDEGLAAHVSDWNRDTNTVTFTNGSQIFFMSESFNDDKELNRFKGLEINGAGLEEFNELNEKTFNKIIERSGSWQGQVGDCPPVILCTCNPTRGWVKENIYDKWRRGTLPVNYAFVPAKITDNPHISKAYIENLKNLPDREYRIFVESDWDAFQLDSLFFEQFQYDKNVAYDLRARNNLPLYLAFDFNISSTCLVIQHDIESIRVLREYHVKGLDQLCFHVSSDFPDFEYIINGDASGNADNSTNVIDYQVIKDSMRLSYSQFRIPKSNPKHKASYRLCSVLMKNFKILIDSSCKGLIKDCQEVQVIQKGNDISIDKSNPDLTHHADPLRYHLHTEHIGKIEDLGLKELVLSSI